MSDKSFVKNGIFHLDGTPTFMISGDYPYYRDTTENWEDRLIKMKAAGVIFVSFYIPWRHHFIKVDENGKQVCDFKGEVKPNKNVKKFIELIQKLGMYAIIKPGPFIHAETDYGGLPDFVNPDTNPKIAPWRNFLALEGRDFDSKNKWLFVMGNALPSPLDPEFLRLTKEYYNLIGKEILAGKVYPKGPIVSVQFLNEGLYSDGRLDYSYAGDYTKNTFKLYRQFLKNQYGSIDGYNKFHSKNYDSYSDIYPITIYQGKKDYKDIKHLLKIIDWHNFGIYYYCRWVNELKESLIDGANGEQLPPYYCNFPPPGSFGQALDVWASRVNPEAFKEQCGIEYGYTNWIGAVNYRKSSYLRYSFLCGRAPGMNLEENWSFGKLYDKFYTYGFTPLYQTLLAICSGTTGFNIYTAVGTAEWDDGIDTKMQKPYPSNSPIHHSGMLTNKYYILNGCVKYFELYGQEFFEAKPTCRMSIGLYQPYIQLAAFAGHDKKLWKKLGFKSAPAFGMDLIGQFHSVMREKNEIYEIRNLTTINLEELSHCRSLIFCSAKFLHKNLQEKLVDYVTRGGILIIFGELPTLDEDFNPCTILIDRLYLKDRKLKKKKLKVIRFRRGTLAMMKGNPFIQQRGFIFQLSDLIYKFWSKLELVFPKIGRIPGKALPRGEIVGMIGNKLGLDKKNSIPSERALKAVELIDSILMCDEYCSPIDTIVSHEDVDVYIFTHPRKDVQHIFIFSLQNKDNIRVRINYNTVDKYFESILVNTTIVGNTCQLIRIENEEISAFISIGLNPISRKKAPLYIEVNKKRFFTNAPIDIAYFNLENEELAICASLRKYKFITLTKPDGNTVKLVQGINRYDKISE